MSNHIHGTLGVAIFLSVLFGSVGANIKDSIVAESSTPAFQQAVQTASHSSNPLDRQVAEAFLHPTPGGGVLAQIIVPFHTAHDLKTYEV